VTTEPFTTIHAAIVLPIAITIASFIAYLIWRR
jgi:hypothetical protein